LVSRTDYTAFGEVRAESGTSPTDYQYTGQRSYLDSFGLHYYVARWYDPVTAHFAQADSIIPQPGNSADWNRYAYVLYNPMRYIDPTGHYGLQPPPDTTPQLDFDLLDAEIDWAITNYFTRKENLLRELAQRFNWVVRGSVTIDQLNTILSAGNTYSLGIHNLFSSIDGDDWIRRNMGGAIFRVGGVANGAVSRANKGADLSFVQGSTVFLNPEFDSFSNPVHHIMHELVHVMESQETRCSLWVGLGTSDKFVEFLGGTTPKGIRFANGTSGVPSEYQWGGSNSPKTYGNTSTVDSWAEAFSWYFIDPSVLPNNGGENLMHTFIIRYVFYHGAR